MCLPFNLDELSGENGRSAAFLMPDSFGETLGNDLATTVSRWLRQEFAPPAGAPLIEGPHFVYDQNPDLFLGRQGRGALRVAWDTNLLIDYFQNGQALWEGQSLPSILPGVYGEELEGLQIIMAIWILRDIRFYIMRHTLRDARERLTERQLEQRIMAFRDFADALAFVDPGNEVREAPPLLLPDCERRRALNAVPDGNDRELVEEAVQSRMHVFLTRDRRVLRARHALRAFGLFIGSPLDLLEELGRCGAMFCLTDPRFGYWPAPDRRRVSHLYHATLSGPYHAGRTEIFEFQSPFD